MQCSAQFRNISGVIGHVRPPDKRTNFGKIRLSFLVPEFFVANCFGARTPTIDPTIEHLGGF